MAAIVRGETKPCVWNAVEDGDVCRVCFSHVQACSFLFLWLLIETEIRLSKTHIQYGRLFFRTFVVYTYFIWILSKSHKNKPKNMSYSNPWLRGFRQQFGHRLGECAISLREFFRHWISYHRLWGRTGQGFRSLPGRRPCGRKLLDWIIRQGWRRLWIE